MEMIGRSNSRRELQQARAAGAVAVLVEDFAQGARGGEVGHASQVDGCFGVAGAPEHAALLGHQRE